MNSIRLDDVLARLSPMNPSPLWGWTLYILALLMVITLFMQKKSSMIITSMTAIFILAVFIDKLLVGSFPNLGKRDFLTFAMRTLFVVIPFMTIGISRWEKSIPPAAIAGILGFGYLIGRWFLEMRV